MGKKGVSAAEKRQKMIDMFQAESTVFTKKEVEKLAPRTGIVSGAVEAVLRELINDDIVHEGKLSGTLFYWSFPGWVVPRAPRFHAAQPRESHSGAARMLSLSLSLQRGGDEEARRAGLVPGQGRAAGTAGTLALRAPTAPAVSCSPASVRVAESARPWVSRGAMPQAKSLLAQIEQMRKAAGQSASEAAELNEQEGLLTSIKAAETEARENIEKEKKKSGQNMHARKRDLKVLKEAANRWTDNLFMIKSKLVESGADVKNVDGMLGTDRIDYIE